MTKKKKPVSQKKDEKKKKKPVSQKKYGKKAREDEKKKFKEGHKAYIEMKKDLDRDNPLPPSSYPPAPPFEGGRARRAMRQRRENIRAKEQNRETKLVGLSRLRKKRR